MDKQRWKPLIGTPSKPPVPPNILVPDPSPAQSAISDADSVTLLPPSPQGSFIHRRRQGQYVPRPPARELFGSAQEIKDYDFSCSKADPIRHQARISARWSGFQLPWISVDDQVRKMADVFYGQPLVVNMMTGQETHHDGSDGPAGHGEQERENLQSQVEKLPFDPSPEIPSSQAVNSGNPSMGTTAIGSNQSSKLLEGSSAVDLPRSVDVASNAGGVVQPVIEPPLSNTPSADIIVGQSTSAHHIDQPAGDPGHLQSEQSAMGPSRRADLGFESPPQHGESNCNFVKLQSHDSMPSITGQMASTQGSSSSTDDATQPTPSDGTRQEPTFLQRAAYAAAHLGAAQRLPRSLRNTDEADIAGLINIPHAPTEPVGADESQQDRQASKKSKRKTILGFFHRSTEHTARSSASPKLAGRQRGRSQEEHAHDDGHEQGAAGSQTPTELRPIVVQEGKKRTMGARMKKWAVRTIGRGSKGAKSNIANPSATNTSSAQPNSILNDTNTDETETRANDDENEKDHSLEEKAMPAKPARLSDAERPLLGSMKHSEVEDDTPRPSDESSLVSQGVQIPQPSTWGPMTSHDTHRSQGAPASSVSSTEDHPSDTTDINTNIDARNRREIATGPIPRYTNPFTKPPRQIPANISPSNLLEERGCQIQQDTVVDPARPAFATEESPFSDEINPRRSYVSDATLNFVYKPKESDTDSRSRSTASKDISPKTTPAMASRPLAAISSDAVNADAVATPSQTPLADITNRNPSPERGRAGLQNLQFPPATAQPTTIVTDTPRQRPVDDVPLEEELILPPAQPGSSFGPRPNELSEEIRNWKKVTKKLESR